MTSENRGAGQVSEHTGAASKQAADLKVEEEAIVEEEREAVHQAAEFTDDGRIKYVQYQETEDAFHDRIVESMYMASLNEPEEPPEPTAKEKCIHRCFQSIHCNISKTSRCFSRRKSNDPADKPAIEMIDYMTPILRRGRSKGWVMHKNLIPDIVKESCRNWWVGFELCTIIIAFVLSITSLSLGKNRIFNILHLVLTIIGTILAVIDEAILLYGGSLFKKCGACYNHDGEEDPSIKYVRFEERDGIMEENNGKCKRCIATTRSTFDFIRMLLSELLFYPLLICDIFEVVTGEAYQFSNVTDGISFTLFAISSASLLFYVYIVRIIILIVGIIHSEKKRKPETKDEKETETQYPDYDPAIRKAAKYFQIYFIYHVAAQMVAQILMIIAIGAKIRDDNSHLFKNTTNIKETSLNSTESSAMENDSIYVSGTLWYMLVAGYVLPVFGLLTFFVVTYFWVQEFPIGFCIDILSVLKAPDIDDVKDFGKTKKEAASKLEKIKKFVHIAELKKQFKDLRQKAFFRKFLYPFFTPQMVIICLIYALLQFSFIICAHTSTSGNGPLGGGHWTTFYVIAVIVGYIANFYVFIVASAWIITIIAVTISTALLIHFFLLVCCFYICGSPSSNNRQRY